MFVLSTALLIPQILRDVSVDVRTSGQMSSVCPNWIFRRFLLKINPYMLTWHVKTSNSDSSGFFYFFRNYFISVEHFCYGYQYDLAVTQNTYTTQMQVLHEQGKHQTNVHLQSYLVYYFLIVILTALWILVNSHLYDTVYITVYTCNIQLNFTSCEPVSR